MGEKRKTAAQSLTGETNKEQEAEQKTEKEQNAVQKTGKVQKPGKGQNTAQEPGKVQNGAQSPAEGRSTGASKALPAGACCCGKQKHRDAEELRDLIHRLNRVEGQIRGIRSMVENDAYCVDILTQVSAASAALTAFSRVLLNNHVRTCVVEDIRGGGDEKTEELLAVLQKFMR